MTLESLNDDRINIHDLTLEKEKRTESESRRLFTELKELKWYDSSDNSWYGHLETNWEMIDNMKYWELIGPAKHTEIQLLGVLTELQFDKTAAKKRLSNLMNSSVYDKNLGQWKSGKNLNEEYETLDRNSFTQLLGILIESQFDKKTAKGRFENLKKTELFDSETNRWLWEMFESQKVPEKSQLELKDSAVYLSSRNIYTNSQLLSIIVEAQFNPDIASRQYQDLKKSDLYDQENKLWYQYARDIEDDPGSHTSSDQLIDVLALGCFDKKEALKQYKDLRSSPLWDPEKEIWWDRYDSLNPVQVDVDGVGSDQQLLGVLCQHLFENEEPNLSPSTPPLPEERKF